MSICIVFGTISRLEETYSTWRKCVDTMETVEGLWILLYVGGSYPLQTLQDNHTPLTSSESHTRKYTTPSPVAGNLPPELL